jgi:NAD(P)-dependent dehydrogenase (short-subunit alcohol dehydrogenase family)
MIEGNREERLDGKVALVTGGTTGIGRAAAELLHRAGAHVVITGQDPDTLERARRELGPAYLVVRADARSIEDAARLGQTIHERFGGLDVAFLNAGIARLAPFEAVDEAFYSDHLDTNLKGVFFTLQKILPLLRAGSSVIVNTSVAALKAAPHLSVYAAAKGAVSSLVRTLAVELAPRGVRINAIAPATIRTPIQAKFGLSPEVMESVAREYTGKIPLGRFGEAREVAELALFLAGPRASYINGTEIAVDGGLLAT